MYTAHVHFLRI